MHRKDPSSPALCTEPILVFSVPQDLGHDQQSSFHIAIMTTGSTATTASSSEGAGLDVWVYAVTSTVQGPVKYASSGDSVLAIGPSSEIRAPRELLQRALYSPKSWE